ncbi:MAG: winged helix-turn-helix transcriptional regulator [Chitinophagaceae bacterium]|nr:winged helix-turn-helix transcriptional regulator [Chitinophagaceae bacterium]
MATKKNDLFHSQDQELAALANALSHPARIAILKYLAQKNECICGDLVAELPLAQSTVSQHLKELKKHGFIKGEIEGVKTCYCIEWNTIEKVKALFNGLFEEIKMNNSNCC